MGALGSPYQSALANDRTGIGIDRNAGSGAGGGGAASQSRGSTL
jgi:hypothetical protein